MNRWGRTLLVAVLVLLLGVALVRATALAGGGDGGGGGPVPGAAVGEQRWYRWAQRHPAMTRALRDAATRVPPGARVEWVVPPPVDRRWVEIMAFYELPAAWTVAVHPRGTAPPAAARGGAEVTHRVQLRADGTAGVRRRGAPPG